MDEPYYIDPVKDKDIIKEIVDTVIASHEHSGKRFYGGAAARVMAQLPKVIMTKKTLIDELDKAFTREANCYF